MKVRKICILDQASEDMEDLANKHQTTYGTCGFITCAVVKYISTHGFSPETIKNVGLYQLAPYIEEAMNKILARRRQQAVKYGLEGKDLKSYLKDWVANYQIEDYLQLNYKQMLNKQIYFFRQVAYDHPQELKHVKHEQLERVRVEQKFKGQKFLFNSFCQSGASYNQKQQFENTLRASNQELPIIIATDILGHFNTTILFKGQIYVLQSLKKFAKQSQNVPILSYIEYVYKQSYLVKQ